jgi:hypothetical protein
MHRSVATSCPSLTLYEAGFELTMKPRRYYLTFPIRCCSENIYERRYWRRRVKF